MTTVLVRCTRCRRKIRTEPLWMFGSPYGPKCGKRYGLSPEPRPRVRQPARRGVPEQPSLLGELDNEEINESEEEPTWS